MKKIATILFTLLLLCPFVGINADTFVPSIDIKNDIYFNDDQDVEGRTVTTTDHNSTISYTDDDACAVDIVITPYVYRETIASQESKDEIVLAMESIQAAENVTDLNADLANRVDAHDETVVTLFDVTVYVHLADSHIPEHNHYQLYNIKMTTEALKNFVALIHYDAESDTWDIVEDARVTGENKDILTFSYDSNSPFAIVVANDSGTPADDSGSGDLPAGHVCCRLHINGHCYCIWILILLILSIILNIYQYKKYKDEKKKREELEEQQENNEESKLNL